MSVQPWLQPFRYVGPNWYAVVMGTAIVPGAGIVLPHQFPGSLRVWQATAVLAFLELVVLVTSRGLHWIFHTDQARADLLDATVAPFYACVSLAFLAVGLICYTVGHTFLPNGVAITLSAVLWSIGTVVGLICSVALTVLMITKHDLTVVGQSPAWLLPPTGTMVSAAFAAPLLEHMAAGQGKALLLVSLYAMVGLDLLMTLVVFPLVMQRLFVYGPLPVQATPALLLGIAPFGQAVNALGNLGDQATKSGIPAPYDSGLKALAIVGGVPIMGFTLLWAAVCVVMLAWAFTKGLKFSMAWWSAPFSWGTIVTGMAGIARHTGIKALSWFTVACYVVLCLLVLYAWPQTLWGLITRTLPTTHPVHETSEGPGSSRGASEAQLDQAS
jgi:tellurite resistance protein TehA-like permease